MCTTLMGIGAWRFTPPTRLRSQLLVFHPYLALITATATFHSKNPQDVQRTPASPACIDNAPAIAILMHQWAAWNRDNQGAAVAANEAKEGTA
jgi:hypothetical protein